MGDLPSRFVRPLHPEEREALERLRREHPRTLGRRAAAVLLSSGRLAIPEIMRRLRVSRPTLAGWFTRFERSGVAGLGPRPRSGRPPKLTPDLRRHIATAVSVQPRDLGMPGAAWTLARLREYLVRAGVEPTVSRESLRLALRGTGLGLKATRTRLIQKGPLLSITLRVR